MISRRHGNHQYSPSNSVARRAHGKNSGQLSSQRQACAYIASRDRRAADVVEMPCRRGRCQGVRCASKSSIIVESQREDLLILTRQRVSRDARYWRSMYRPSRRVAASALLAAYRLRRLCCPIIYSISCCCWAGGRFPRFRAIAAEHELIAGNTAETGSKMSRVGNSRNSCLSAARFMSRREAVGFGHFASPPDFSPRVPKESRRSIPARLLSGLCRRRRRTAKGRIGATCNVRHGDARAARHY